MNRNEKLYVAVFILSLLGLFVAAVAVVVNVAVYLQRAQIVESLADLEKRVSALEAAPELQALSPSTIAKQK